MMEAYSELVVKRFIVLGEYSIVFERSLFHIVGVIRQTCGSKSGKSGFESQITFG